MPVLLGALARIPIGMLADRFGGRVVFTVLMFFVAVPVALVPATPTSLSSQSSTPERFRNPIREDLPTIRPVTPIRVRVLRQHRSEHARDNVAKINSAALACALQVQAGAICATRLFSGAGGPKLIER